MKFNKLALPALPALIALVCSPVHVMAAVATPPTLGSGINKPTVFANTYVTTGANSWVIGDVDIR